MLIKLNRSLPSDSKPLHLVSMPEIARKPKPPVSAEQNGLATGVASTSTSNGILGRRKRDSDVAEIMDEPPTKKRVGATVKSIPGQEEAIVIDDAGDGAIVIDDD